LSINKGFIFLIVGALLSGCASTHHSVRIGWEGEKIRLEFTPPDVGSPILKCLSCNEALPPLPLEVNNQGIAYIKIDDVRSAIVSRFHLTGSGIDTALTLQQPLTSTGIKDSLIGRIMAIRYTVIYKDTTMNEQIGALERKDEVNLFGEDDLFYYIHYPHYPRPVVLLRSNAVRIQ
jgi:hypothetical protein